LRNLAENEVKIAFGRGIPRKVAVGIGMEGIYEKFLKRSHFSDCGASDFNVKYIAKDWP